MIEPEPERLEEGLRRISPAPAPQDLMQRLRTAVETRSITTTAPRRSFRWPDWLRGWRSLIMTGPAAALMLIVWLAARPAVVPGGAKPSDATGIRAVQVDHSLLASFDEVAQLPGGEPVRFRYREWQDKVVIRDAVHGTVISQTTPRVEVVPVRFETY